MRKGLICLLVFGCLVSSFAQTPDSKILQVKAPEVFRAEFKTTKGLFTIEATRKWSPLGVDRLYQLISSGYFTQSLFFRVERNYVIQFGIASSYPVNRFWDPKKIPDEPVLQKNTKSTISFVRGGANNRATQLFINMADNAMLDTASKAGAKGFPPVAKVIKGMDVVIKLNDQYGKMPAMVQDSLYKYSNPYFEKLFPGLDKILSATLVK
jgi:cyclophilin family peptidyl-prolyl cis-trans isomerase